MWNPLASVGAPCYHAAVPSDSVQSPNRASRNQRSHANLNGRPRFKALAPAFVAIGVTESLRIAVLGRMCLVGTSIGSPWLATPQKT
jgi:hypothetical protein